MDIVKQTAGMGNLLSVGDAIAMDIKKRTVIRMQAKKEGPIL